MGAETQLRSSNRRRSRRAFIKGALMTGAVASTPAVADGAGAGEQAGGRLGPFDHVSLPMQNTEAMLAFYRGLGMAIEESPQICMAHFGDQKINFHQPALWQQESFTMRAPAARPPCGDLCFVWDGSTASLTETLERLGAPIIEGPVARPGGRAGGTVGGTSRYVRDPDGNLIEFIIYA